MKIIIADDHTLVRRGIVALLQGVANIEIVAECGDGIAALAAIEQWQPDIALLDISMPGKSGIEVATHCRELGISTHIVLLSMHDKDIYVREALAAGVKGYVLKDADFDELPLALNAVMRGATYLSPSLSGKLTSLFAASEPALGPEVLTPRQRETLVLLARGLQTKEIALQLNVSPKTVETHRAQIMERLQIRDVQRLVKFAIRHGLSSADDE